MMTQQDAKRPERPAGPSRHPLTDRMTARFLRNLPAFKVVDEIPAHLRALLKQLEEAEENRQGRAGTGA